MISKNVNLISTPFLTFTSGYCYIILLSKFLSYYIKTQIKLSLNLFDEHGCPGVYMFPFQSSNHSHSFSLNPLQFINILDESWTSYFIHHINSQTWSSSAKSRLNIIPFCLPREISLFSLPETVLILLDVASCWHSCTIIWPLSLLNAFWGSWRKFLLSCKCPTLFILGYIPLHVAVLQH